MIEISYFRLAAELGQHNPSLRVVLDVGHRVPGMLPGPLALGALRHDVGRFRLLAAVVGDPEAVHAGDVLPLDGDLVAPGTVSPLLVALELRQEGLPHDRVALRPDPLGELLD